MINGIGNAGRARLELVPGSVERSPSVEKRQSGSPSERAGGTASNLVAEMAAEAPVDSAKVAVIRAAIVEGRYPVDPQKIAASMLALDLPAQGE